MLIILGTNSQSVRPNLNAHYTRNKLSISGGIILGTNSQMLIILGTNSQSVGTNSQSVRPNQMLFILGTTLNQ